MIDTHCHLTYDGLSDRVEDVLVKARGDGVDRVITVGTSPADTRRGVALAERYDNVYATAGVHPHHAGESEDASSLRALLRHPRVVALGEMGLDWHYPEPAADAQYRAFHEQLELMREFPDLPAIIHNREATDDTLGVLRESGLPGDRFVFHCFTGTPEEVVQVLDFGAYVGFTGVVTFKNATAVAEASDLVPLDRMFIETDAPYLTPAPHRKIKTNEPRYVSVVARFLAERRGMELPEFTRAVDASAERFFRLDRADAGPLEN